MQKLLLLLLPLAIAACVERDSTRAAIPESAAPAPPAVTTSPGAPAQRATGPGRGEGELESAAPAADVVAQEEMPDGSLDVSAEAGETSDVERNRASSSDEMPNDPLMDPTSDPAIIDESGATGFGGRVLSPERLGDGEQRPDDDGVIEENEVPLLPADVIDAGPAMIP